FEDAAVMRLEADTAHGAGDADLAEIPRAALQRLNQWSTCDDAADAADVEPIAFRAERLLDQRRGIRSLFREDTEHVDGKSRVFERGEAFAGPRGVLKYADRKSCGICVDHWRVIYHDGRRRRRRGTVGRVGGRAARGGGRTGDDLRSDASARKAVRRR